MTKNNFDHLTTTEYLFGHNKEFYGEALVELATQRITHANELMQKLTPQISYIFEEQDDYQQCLRVRIAEIEDALKVWRKILEIEEGFHVQ